MVFEQSPQAERRADLERAAFRWRRDMVALGVTDAEATYCENALWTFARTTTHPHVLVVGAGREILRSQVLRGEPLLPSDPDAWAGKLLARFQSPKIGTYWMLLPEWVQMARRVWLRLDMILPARKLVGPDPFTEPPPSFRLHPMDMADVGASANENAGEGGGGSRPTTDVRHIGDAVALTRAIGREAEGRYPRQDGRLAREVREKLQVNQPADR
jgi:hypothetical protein